MGDWMAANSFGQTGVSDLGLGFGAGDALNSQVKDLTEEERRRRMLGLGPVNHLFGTGGMGSGFTGGYGSIGRRGA